MRFIQQPATSSRIGDFLQSNLDKNWPEFTACIAFVKRSGTRHIANRLARFSKKGNVELLVGIDHGGTSKEGLEDLLNAIGPAHQLHIVHNEYAVTFHPKIYMFKNSKAAEIVIGSGNMTEGGLFTNYEAAIHLCLDFDVEEDRALLAQIEKCITAWRDPSTGTSLQLDAALLSKLVANGYVPVEALSAGGSPGGAAAATKPKIFKGANVPPPPAGYSTGAKKSKVGAVRELVGSIRGFVMTLQQTDVGRGQTTVGTSARSPEIFIPLKARDEHPDFWHWPSGFTETPTKYDRSAVKMLLGSALIDVNIMGWKLKKDFRLRSEALRSGGSLGDILRIEQMDPSSAYDYYVEVVPQGTSLHPVYLARCTTSVPNSKKKYGYY
jgi:HKD family nuclease